MNKLVAEFLGTLLFLYVILATGSAIPIGITLAVSIMIFGPFSGGNFNPAVTIMMVAKGAQPASDLLAIYCCSSSRRFSSFGIIQTRQNINCIYFLMKYI